MPDSQRPPLPVLPLLLWETPPGLELILAQEGVPVHVVERPRPFAFEAGRFVLYDGRRVGRSQVRRCLDGRHVAIDVALLREGEPTDPFADLIDPGAGLRAWQVGPHRVAERVAHVPRAAIRARLLGRLRDLLTRSGGVWARLAAYPAPYRAAFNFRADLDEPYPEDYFAFARARAPLDDCTTHFVSTRAYGESPDVLADLARLDTQSHGHHHVVTRDGRPNRRNLERAHEILVRAGITPTGFAAPEGRWNPGLDRAIAAMGYRYSSDFSLGHDDRPFFPVVDGRPGPVLQVPIHPVCEGLFLDRGITDGRLMSAYFAEVVRRKLDAGEPAFVYGHPERRLAYYPEILARLAESIEGQPRVWRVTLTAFAAWWRWRSARRWSLVPKGPGVFEVQFEEWDTAYPLALEIQRGSHVATVRPERPWTRVELNSLAYERRLPRVDLPHPEAVRQPWTLRHALRHALDWETVTPLADLPADGVRALLKRGLRRIRPGRRPSR
jgi:hypothetical protein